MKTAIALLLLASTAFAAAPPTTQPTSKPDFVGVIAMLKALPKDAGLIGSDPATSAKRDAAYATVVGKTLSCQIEFDKLFPKQGHVSGVVSGAKIEICAVYSNLPAEQLLALKVGSRYVAFGTIKGLRQNILRRSTMSRTTQEAVTVIDLDCTSIQPVR